MKKRKFTKTVNRYQKLSKSNIDPRFRGRTASVAIKIALHNLSYAFGKIFLFIRHTMLIVLGLICGFCFEILFFHYYKVIHINIPENLIHADYSLSYSTDQYEDFTNKRILIKNNLLKTISIKDGYSLFEAIVSEGFSPQDCFAIVSQINNNILSRLRPQQKVEIMYDELTTYENLFQTSKTKYNLPMQQKITKHLALNTMTIKIGGSATKIFAKRDKKNRMIVTVSEIKALLKNVKASGVINTSLFVDAIEAGVPPSIIVGLISEYSFDVDFQRDIRKGDSFVIVYEEYYDEEDIKIKDGSLLYGSLVLRGKQYEMYNFMGNFYDSKGHENKKELLKTPVDGARISGFFGMRKHPILGFTRAHQGIDFAVPKGTPVKAAGNGVVEFVGRRGGYGNLISIRHGSEYKTNYAHLSAFRRGIQKGSKVNQGTVIGYVGSTGLATGPHLHYEVEKFGKKINPRKMIVKSSKKLSEALMPNFNQQIKRIKRFVNKNKDGKYDQEFSD